MAKKRPSAKNKISTVSENVGELLEDFEHFRNLAAQAVPKEDDQWHVNEIALAVQEYVKLLGQHYRKISAICDKTEDKSINVGLSLVIDRRNTPAEVSVKIGFREAYSDLLCAKVPDPEQTEMPLFTSKRSTKEPKTTYTVGEEGPQAVEA